MSTLSTKIDALMAAGPIKRFRQTDALVGHMRWVQTSAGVLQGLLREPIALGTHTPCTVLWGTQDRSHRLTDPQAVLCDVPQAEVMVFDDCGHFPDLENPQRFLQILLAQVLPQVILQETLLK